MQKEGTAFAYVAAAEPEPAAEPLAVWRESYAAEVLRFEDRFKNTAAQGQLSEKKADARVEAKVPAVKTEARFDQGVPERPKWKRSTIFALEKAKMSSELNHGGRNA